MLVDTYLNPDVLKVFNNSYECNIQLIPVPSDDDGYRMCEYLNLHFINNRSIACTTTVGSACPICKQFAANDIIRYRTSTAKSIYVAGVVIKDNHRPTEKGNIHLFRLPIRAYTEQLNMLRWEVNRGAYPVLKMKVKPAPHFKFSRTHLSIMTRGMSRKVCAEYIPKAEKLLDSVVEVRENISSPSTIINTLSEIVVQQHLKDQ